MPNYRVDFFHSGPNLSVAPLTFDFGTVDIGSSSTTTITVTNIGTLPLVIGNVAVANPVENDFTIINDNASGHTVQPNGSVSFDLRFTPTVTGNKTTTFDIPSDDPSEGTATITGLASGNNPIPPSYHKDTNIIPGDFQTGDAFGVGLGISGDGSRLVVCSPNEDGGAGDPLLNSGCAYVYEKTNSVWGTPQIIRANDRTIDDRLGYDMACAMSKDGTTIVIGAKYQGDPDDGNPSEQGPGSAYVFTKSGETWAQAAVLRASDRQAVDYFGGAVAINLDGSVIAVGATEEDGGAGDPINSSGAVYVYTKSGASWVETQILRASDRQTLDDFGSAIAMTASGDTIMITAPGEDGGGGDPLIQSGCIYEFRKSGSTWGQNLTYRASDKQASDLFGTRCAISSDGLTLIVSTPYEDGGAGNPVTDSGAAYVYTRAVVTNSWTGRQILRPSVADRFTNDFFGNGLAINSNGSILMVSAGAMSKTFIYTRSGTSYSNYTWTNAYTVTSGTCVACTNDGLTLVTQPPSFDQGKVYEYNFY